MKKIIISIMAVIYFLSPVAAFAQNTYTPISACQNLSSIASVASCALGIINLIIPIIVAITVVWTIYSSFELARTEGDDRKKWGWAIFYGLLAIFLMISVYGLVNIFTGTFEFSGSSVSAPNLNNVIVQ
ncbi:MAG TPA: hypothetical protein VMR73_01410 [Candidatus Paceibacterota bacterium]|nr:hypothetical protein [Candidatus Paceibacterota bacterium]